ncbi:MAG: hypothetical protein JW892_13260 [Anaerolineae bacterium]|nr:hypothetical protein [Anaerolineae bacterium]
MEGQSKVHRSRNRSTFLLLRAGLIVTLFLLLCAQWTLEPLRAAPSIEAGAYWSLTPNPLTIEGCEVVAVTVRINDVINLYGADVIVSFDPTILEVVDKDGNLGNASPVENAGMLSGTIFVAKNEANNTAGTVQYAVTLLNPAPPVTGSGEFIRIYFRAKAAGTSALHFSYFKLATLGGEEIPSTAVDGSAVTTAPDAAAVTISRLNSTDARLSWPAVTGVDGYHIYRDTIPYFTPSGTPYATVTAGSYDDADALGDVVTNHFYVVRSACTNGFESANSNRVGEYDYPLNLTSSANYGDIAIVFSNTAYKDAAGLASYIGTGVVRIMSYSASTQSFRAYLVGNPSTNFPLSVGDFVFVANNQFAPPVVTMVGNVPDPQTVAFTLVSGSPARYNYISMPLDQDMLTSASLVAASVGTGVVRVMKYQTPTQSFLIYTPGNPATDFSLTIGEPFVLLLGPGAPGIWPQ